MLSRHRLRGLAMTKNAQMQTCVTRRMVEPISRPYRVHTLCGLISLNMRMSVVETKRPTGPEVRPAARRGGGQSGA